MEFLFITVSSHHNYSMLTVLMFVKKYQGHSFIDDFILSDKITK